MSEYSNLRRVWLWIATTGAAWVLGLTASCVAFVTVSHWQMKLIPPEQLPTDELLAGPDLWLWIVQWTQAGFWICLYFAGLCAAWFWGTIFYHWAQQRCSLHGPYGALRRHE